MTSEQERAELVTWRCPECGFQEHGGARLCRECILERRRVEVERIEVIPKSEAEARVKDVTGDYVRSESALAEAEARYEALEERVRKAEAELRNPTPLAILTARGHLEAALSAFNEQPTGTEGK